MHTRTGRVLRTVAATAILLSIGLDAPAVQGRAQLDRATLEREQVAPGLLDNGAFMPPPEARPAAIPFAGELRVSETPMRSLPGRIHDGLLHGLDPQLFPALELAFVSVDGELLPVQRGVQARAGGSSYWDVIVDPGRVWSEPGDGGLSRASFPFVLMNRLEGEGYNGIATFLYDGERASALAFQVVQQTAPFNLRREFVAWGTAQSEYRPRAGLPREALAAERALERAARLRVEPWSALSTRFPAASPGRLADPASDPNAVLLALADGDTVYTDGCRSAAGPYPYCEAMRHGVWSVGKVLAAAVALMRLAEVHGESVYALRIADLLGSEVPEPWRAVTLRDAADMATGIGTGSHVAEPNDINSGYLDDGAAYDRWYNAPTLEARLAETFREAAYPWGPGKVARYRDQDPLVLAAAMQRLLQSREGPAAGLGEAMMAQVYRPIGIRHLPQTVLPVAAGGPPVPVLAYGAYPTLADMVRVAQLLQRRGEWNGEQLLSRAAIERFMPLDATRGFATGEVLPDGETRYLHYFWHQPFASGDCRANVAEMRGWGGNVVAIYPNGMVGVRVAHDGSGEEYRSAELARLAHAARSFCTPPA